ncbi:MAG: fumarylacetoacetate hydrolase family protein [Halioglobus sp.]|nr:fumarylacetoacetate hydrolase family protein [Halioglobus sp.]
MQTILISGQPFTPSKIVCVGRNYVAHIQELGNEMPADMVIFNKPNSAISDILHSQIADQPLHFESELCFLATAGQLSAVAFGLDLTKRELQSTLQHKGLPWERAKAFDGSALFSQFVALPTDPSSLSLRLSVDGELRQAGGVGMMIYPPHVIVEEISRFMTLEDGDVIMTGTPAGVGRVHTGERFEGSVLAGGEVLVDVAWVAQ